MLGVGDVRAVMVERRHTTNQTCQHCHGVCISTEATQKELHLLVHHGVGGNQAGEFCFFLRVGQISVQKQVASFHKVALSRQLLNGVATVEQFTFVAINIGNGRLARCG